MKLFLTSVAAALTVVALGFGTLAPTQKAEAAKPSGSVAVPVAGAIGTGGTFDGTFNVNEFVFQNGQLMAVGTLSGTLLDTAGTVIGTVADVPISVPVAAAVSSCEILDLVLGPLDLDLLGLVVHLDTVHLNITAEQGPGNLLGNLLCGLVGILDGQGSINTLLNRLNRILTIIG